MTYASLAAWLRRALSAFFLVALLLHTSPTQAQTVSPVLKLLADRVAAGDVELLVSCADPAAMSWPVTLTVDGSKLSPVQALPLRLAPSLVIVAQVGSALDGSGTLFSDHRHDLLAQAELLLAHLPADGSVSAIAYEISAEVLASPGPASMALAGLAARARQGPALHIGARGDSLSAALELARDQLAAAAPGPRALVLFAVSEPPRPVDPILIEQLRASAAQVVIVGLDAQADEALANLAATLDGNYLPYHTAGPDELPGLLDALGARYASLAAASGLQIRASLDRLAPGFHTLVLQACGGTLTSSVMFVPVDSTIWPLVQIAGGAGVAGVLCLALIAVLLRRQRRIAARAPVFVASPGKIDAEYITAGQLSVPDVPTERYDPAVAAPAPVYRLVFSDGRQRRSFRLDERQCLIGRDPGCDLQINSRAVSALHARLAIVAGRLELTDLDSTNGTFIGAGDRRLIAHTPELLEVGDEFWLGSEIQISLRGGDLD